MFFGIACSVSCINITSHACMHACYTLYGFMYLDLLHDAACMPIAVDSKDNHAYREHAHDWLLRTKGPAEKTMFPTVSQTTNPFQVLPQFLMTLGKKIDSASLVKAGTWVLVRITTACMYPWVSVSGQVGATQGFRKAV